MAEEAGLEAVHCDGSTAASVLTMRHSTARVHVPEPHVLELKQDSKGSAAEPAAGMSAKQIRHWLVLSARQAGDA